MIDRNNNGNNMLPITNVDMEENSDVKLNEDQYEVYVNGDFVGRKTLKTQGEKLTDIDEFLRNQGFSNFTSSAFGDHYRIQVDQKADDLSNALSVYFQNR